MEHLCKDITKVDASDLNLNGTSSLVTIGGPPCQAYSRIGRSKLKSLGEHRFGLNDKRAFLYKEFIRLGVELDSKAIVMENVPESVNFFDLNAMNWKSMGIMLFGQYSIRQILVFRKPVKGCL